MKIPIDGVQAFVHVAELGSFNRAAEHLFITQTALTRRIQRLEAFVDLRLLDRTTRSTALSPMGKEFLPLARRIVDDLVHGLDRLRTSSRLGVGDVTVATLQSVAFRQLPFALRSYARKYPKNRIHLLERSGALVTEAVQQGQADFGIHIQQDVHPDLTEDVLMRDPFVLVCSRSHPTARFKKVAWADLKGIDLITLGGASGNRRIVESQFAKAGLDARGRFVVESTPSAIALARANVGAAILPAAMNATNVTTGLIEVPLVEPVLYRTIALVRRRNETLSPAANSLYAMIKARLSAVKRRSSGE
ncbi:LysR family transcriptional regulator [Bradyrhizobium sp. CB3481]|uniref:LysR family transcriptional regulator n=1 Tax=Bradyrhizobium sp. CB3481 TaxID=3039158 RepID=UPI0024B281D2|nr:LysR family transcriptional regulator [Bradyrhizobium sp. CB3481]WFU19429.1 LysR family transcriptional regulator [Bradyrhizobium sp. CB3481]